MNNQPVWKQNEGSLSAAAWHNERKSASGGTYQQVTVQLERRYKDAGGAWKSTNRYTLDELFRLQRFVGRVIDRVIADRQEAGTGGADSSDGFGYAGGEAA